MKVFFQFIFLSLQSLLFGLAWSLNAIAMLIPVILTSPLWLISITHRWAFSDNSWWSIAREDFSKLCESFDIVNCWETDLERWERKHGSIK